MARKTSFQKVPSPFGVGTDEAATARAFEDYVGGVQRAERLNYLYHNSYAAGTEYDKLMGNESYRTRQDTFRLAAAREGYSPDEIEAFLSL